jgi:hypothetical protein
MHHSLGFAVSVFMAYIVAQFVVAWVQATNSISLRLNGITTYRQYIQLNAAIFLYRLLVGLGVWLVYAEYSVVICTWASELTGYLGWLARYPIPVNPATTVLWGLFADPILHMIFGLVAKKVPGLGFLSVEVPPTVVKAP